MGAISPAAQLLVLGGSRYVRLRNAAIAAARRNNASLWFAGAPADLAGFVWQDSAGTTPATGTDPIGLLLDRQYGAGNLGANIRPALNTWAPYVGSATPTAAGFDITTSGGNGGVFVNAATVAGKTYRFQAILRRGTTNAVALKTAFGTIGTTTSLTDVLISGVFTASGATTALNIENGATPGTSFASSVSLVEVFGIPALQATAANKPTLELQANGYYGMRFDGTSDGLNISPLQTINFNSNTVIVAGRQISGASGGCFAQRSSVNDLPINGQIEFNSAGARFIHRSTAGVLTQAIGAATGTFNTVLSGVSVSGSDRVLYVNGVVSATSANTTGSADVTTQTIGYYNTPAPGGFLNGVLHLICASPGAMSDPDRIAIERFAALLSGATYT